MIGRFWLELDHDWWRYLVSPTPPILVEMEDDESPPDSVVNDTANDLLPGWVLRKKKESGSQNPTYLCRMAKAYILTTARGIQSEGWPIPI